VCARSGLAAGELHLSPVDHHPPRILVELHRSAPKRLLGAEVAACPSQLRPHPRYHFGRRERLDHVVIGPQLEAGDPLGLLSPRGDEDDRYPRLSADASDHLEAVELGEHDVDERDVDPAATQQRQRVQAITGLQHLVALLLQIQAEKAPKRMLVIDDQYPHCRPHKASILPQRLRPLAGPF
jgi:hypothetical protein